MSEKNNTKMFIVYGHGEAALSITQSFIKKLGYNPLFLEILRTKF